MSYRDEMQVCAKCGARFVYTVEEQRWQTQLGFSPAAPELCPECREADSAQPGLRPGIVKWYSPDKAFGFIIQADGSEIFFHRTSVVGDVAEISAEQTPVWYEVQQSDKGPKAVDVHKRE